MSNEAKKSFKNSLNLPTTNFPIIYQHAQSEPEILAWWKQKEIWKNYEKGDKKFVLHDGPPYTNGNIHIGHALNKILKDIVVKSKKKQGYAVHFKLGWDCHGMPIEIKIAEKLGLSKEQIKQDPVAFKKACREYSDEWIKVQKEEFARLGVIADYENHYETKGFEYEADIVRSFGKFSEQGYIMRREKTVPWCASCSTVLATAEIEYKDRKDPSVFVKFDLDESSKSKLLSNINAQAMQNKSISMLVWTTTPWTLPLNRALMCHPTGQYSLVQTSGSDYLILGSDLVSKMSDKLKKVNPDESLTKLATFESKLLQGLNAHHPTDASRVVPILLEDIVGLEDGTAVVHCAPGCGPEDYLVGIKNNLEIFSPISPDGKYLPEIKVAELIEKPVSEGQFWMIKYLADNNKLLFKENIAHSYPHCWRCYNGLIFRATRQWFCDLKKHDLLPKLTQEIEKISFYPDWGKARFASFIGSRTEWCISRQRTWGVPIIAIKCKNCDHADLSPDLINNVANKIAQHGIEYWDLVSMQELESLGFKASQTCNCQKSEWVKEKDILDVWFDSGVSHTAVLKKDSPDLYPADLYLEGSDQHRGWFQSSNICAVVLNGKACQKAILTHGYVVDGKGFKMSKSRGNVIAPNDIISKYGAEVLRLWVACSDYSKDVSISLELFTPIAEMFRKIRNTCRFLISNLFDFDAKTFLETFEKDLEHLKSITLLDKIALLELCNKLKNLDILYNEYNFTAVVAAINNYCVTNLSAGYLDMAKDRLYVDEKFGQLRNSCQKSLAIILMTLCHKFSPILSFTAEDLTKEIFGTDLSIFELEQLNLDRLELVTKIDQEVKLDEIAQLLYNFRDHILKGIEELRAQKIIKHSLEAKIELWIDVQSKEGALFNKIIQIAQEHEGCVRFFKDWLIVSQVNFTPTKEKLNSLGANWFYAKVAQADGVKCPRCWQFELTDHPDELCSRCAKIIG